MLLNSLAAKIQDHGGPQHEQHCSRLRSYSQRRSNPGSSMLLLLARDRHGRLTGNPETQVDLAALEGLNTKSNKNTASVCLCVCVCVSCHVSIIVNFVLA